MKYGDMRMSVNRKFIITTLAAVLMIALVPSIGNSQGLKIGFVKDDQIKLGYKAWQRAQESWELERKAWDDEATAKQIEFDELLDEYEKQKLILSDEKKREKEAAIRAKQESLEAFTRQIYGPGGTAERKQEQLISPVLDNVTNAIKAVAEEGNYDVIFTLQSSLGYIRESFDVTEKVLEYLDKLE